MENRRAGGTTSSRDFFLHPPRLLKHTPYFTFKANHIPLPSQHQLTISFQDFLVPEATSNKFFPTFHQTNYFLRFFSVALFVLELYLYSLAFLPLAFAALSFALPAAPIA